MFPTFSEESALSAFLYALFTKLSSSEVIEFANARQACRKELRTWGDCLIKLQAVLDDAEARGREDSGVRSWLEELQRLAYDVDDILDVFATKSLERKVKKQKQQVSTSKPSKCTFNSFMMSSAFKFNIKMMPKMKDITRRLEDLGKQGSLFHLRKIHLPERFERRLRTTSLVNESMVCGREADKNAILELLLDYGVDCEGIGVIPIIGMPGIGKTTLAQLVYKDGKVDSSFDIKTWVYVSEQYDVIRITKQILQMINFDDYGATDLLMLQVKLKEKLYGKKFLLVLDDVWNENYADWEILKSPLEAGASGSKIVVTTRVPFVSEVMGTIPAYSLEGLSEEACLSIFTNCALGRPNFSEHPHLEEIGKEIVTRCSGLPLALKTVGGALRGRLDPNEWKRVLQQDTWDFALRDFNQALHLSYNHLHSHLKRCFAYCSIFPKDYEFREEEVVLLWISEGFLSKATNKKEMEDLGRAYFQDLVARSFFQGSITNRSGFVMQPSFRDLAKSVAGKIFHRLEGNRLISIPQDVRHLSYDSGSRDEFKNFIAPKRCRTFIPFAPPQHTAYRCIPYDVLLNLLPKLKFLRVFSLREFSMTRLPDSIGALRHLRYLDLSQAKIQSLPDSVCSLPNLQTLLLRHCRKLERLSSKIGNLINLCHLDNTGTISLRRMPIQIGELTNLQTLPSFVLAPGDGGHIRALKGLLNLRGELSISGLQNVVIPDDALEAGLGEKLGLKKLKLKWLGNFDRTLCNGVETEVLDMLQPTKMLEELTVEGYGGTVFPNWVGNPSFTNLLSLELISCKKFKSMPSVGKLPQLKHLCIRGSNCVNSVGVEFYGENQSSVFEKLETLCFEDMLEWEEWNPCEVDDQSGNFPCLRELSILMCPKLSGRLPTGLPSLEKLVIRNCRQLEVSVSTFQELRELEIDGCRNLVHESHVNSGLLKNVSLSKISEINCLAEKLMLGFREVESLSIDGCEELISLWPDKKRLLAQMGSLDVLKISNCPKLVLLRAEEDEEELQQLELSRSVDYLNLSIMSSERIKKLPKASRVFTSLREMEIERCPKLVSFSESSFPLTLKRLVIRSCKNLQYLLYKGKGINGNNTSLLEHVEIEGCSSLISLSSSCELSVRLQNQQIDHGSKLASLSSGAKLLAGIKKLRINDCPELMSISIELLVGLQRLQIWTCPKLTALSSRGKLPVGLKRLQISNCAGLESVAQTVQDNPSLEYIGVIACTSIQSLPQGLEKLENLQEIDLVYCPKLGSFPESKLPTTLRELEIDGCHNLQTLPNNFNNLIFLQKLSMSNCSLPEEGFPFNLKSLAISQPKTQKTLKEWELHKLTSLEQLMIDGGCPNVVSFPPKESEMILPTSLVDLTVKDFPSLKFLSSRGFEKLKSLKYLSIMDCPKVVSLPTKDTLGLLYRLHIDDCPLLKSWCSNGGLEWDKIAHIPYVRIDDKLITKED